MKISLLMFSISILFSSCITNPVSQPPILSDLTPLGGKIFTAYISPDRQIKPDTVAASCNFSGISLNSIHVSFSLDSGLIWIDIHDSIWTNGNKIFIRWAPRDDSTYFTYFGPKECRLRISGGEECFIESEPFTILGSLPFELLSPKGGETFKSEDTIFIIYRTNADLVSQIRIFFTNDILGRWAEITAPVKRTDDTSLPIIRSFNTFFYPPDYKTIFGYMASVRFLLKDYNSPLPNSSIETAEIYFEH